MVRTQVLLTEEQLRALRTLSAERGVSMAVLVREAVDALIHADTDLTAEERRRRALEAIGRFASGHKDVSARHDDYLEEAYRAQHGDRRR